MSVFDKKLLKEIRELRAELAEVSRERDLCKDLAQRLGGHGQVIHEMLVDIRQRVIALADSQGRMEEKMPTREELDAAKAQLMQAIADATTRVTADIQALRDQIAAGNPITDQDLADLQADIGAVGQIDPANPTPPTRRGGRR